MSKAAKFLKNIDEAGKWELLWGHDFANDQLDPRDLEDVLDLGKKNKNSFTITDVEFDSGIMMTYVIGGSKPKKSDEEEFKSWLEDAQDGGEITYFDLPK